MPLIRTLQFDMNQMAIRGFTEQIGSSMAYRWQCNVVPAIDCKAGNLFKRARPGESRKRRKVLYRKTVTTTPPATISNPPISSAGVGFSPNTVNAKTCATTKNRTT